MLAHRVLERNLNGESWYPNKVRLEEQCQHVSQMERKAMEAERESVKYKQVEFMEKHLGEVFTGYISGFSERGIFVELKGSHCEGMAGFDTMKEPFELESSRLRIRGLYTGQIHRLGDEIKVRIIRTDLGRRQIDMAWVEED